MKAVIKTEHFRNALNKVISVIDKKNEEEILQHGLITLSNGELEILGTDLDVSAKSIIKVISEDTGKFCINVKRLFDILRELPDTEVTIELQQEENKLNLNCGDIHFSVLVYPNNQFPHLVFETHENNFVLSSKQITEIINKTSHSISIDDTRPYLNGIFLQEVDSKLRAVSTDGHRLALLETPLESTGQESLINGVIVPRKGVLELKKMADSYPDKMINLSVDETLLYAFAQNESFLSIRLIAKDYPKYQAVIPNRTTHNLTVDKDALFDAVKRVRLMSSEKSNGIKMSLRHNEMIIAAHNAALGSADQKVSMIYDGKEIDIGFNARFIMDALSVFESGDVSIELNNELSPIVLKSSTLPNFLGIVMPLKL